ncbi:MAG: hypothetical protein AAF515_19175 [Pseudomonadota bacterium]
MISKLILGLSFIAIVSGCVSPSKRYVEGNSPEYANEEVRFRTTYFFRVYDYCYDKYSGNKHQPRTDSLYRFVMTGKANPSISKIHFESGTLKASQIDPFGATVEYDDKHGNYRIVTQAEARKRSQRAEALGTIDTLLELQARMGELSNREENKIAVRAETTAAIQEQIEQAINRIGNPAPPENVQASQSPANALACPPGSEVQRGFQIMGPQGVKTFDQEDRLLMAMSSNAKPLIGALAEVSGRMFRAQVAEKSTAELVLPLLREQLRVSRIEDTVQAIKETDDLETVKNNLNAQLIVDEE